MHTWTNEDIEKVEKYIELKNKGYYCDGTQLTNDYNRILEKHVNPTSCGSCIRQRITELEGALNHYKKQQELAAMSGFTNVEDYKEEVKAVEEELNIKPKTKKSKK